MGHKHTRDDLLAGALAAAFDDGLSLLTFGRVARRLGVNDRIVVYYFPTKNDLIGAVIGSMGLELQERLAAAFTAPAPNHRELVRAAWPVLARPDADPVFALFFEATGLAAAGQQPYDTLIPVLIDGWIEWASSYLDGSPEHRLAEAAAAVALIDGLLLLRQTAGAPTADSAAAILGIA